MIHHISVAAEEPRRAAEVLAELWGGYAMPFPPFPGAYIALPGDRHGTAIEVCPLGAELLPGGENQEVQARQNEGASPYTATHAALSVAISEERIKEIAAREGWRAEKFSRGPFHVVEFWVENRLLVELLTPAMAEEYLSRMTPEGYAAFFGFELPPRAGARAEAESAGAEEPELVAV